MSSNLSLTPWACLLAVTFLTTGRLLHADDKPVTLYGDKMVPIKSGGKTTYVKVQDSVDPLRNVVSTDTSGKYNPENLFSRSSSMANKTFSSGSISTAKSDSAFTDREQNTFITPPYLSGAHFGTDRLMPNLDAKVPVATSDSFNQDATGFNKKYGAKSDPDQLKAAKLTTSSETSSDQGRTAALGDHTTSTYASPMAGKTFQGPEADAVHRSLTRLKNGQMLITDLPNRPLTVDEVRALLNHGFKPDTDEKPEEPSKPLNDPDYKPEPLRESPAPSREDDKDDAVPPPGTMAQPPPENSEPLPQR